MGVPVIYLQAPDISIFEGIIKGKPEVLNDWPPIPVHNILRENKPFVGRTQQIIEINRMLKGNKTLVLLGEGGIGKTALAINVALWNLSHSTYPGGVPFINLELPKSSEMIIEEIGVVLLGSEFRTMTGDRLGYLKEYFKKRPGLVILDNFETVRDDSAVLQLVHELNQYSSLLITSRESIMIGSIVPVKELDTEMAVGLFVLWALDSGWDCKGDVDDIRTICEELLGNMPLAIELVVPQAASLPLSVIKERIEKDLSVIAADRPDLPARQRSMVACFNFSYERLTDPAKLIFTRLSVFVGGANPITISEICEIKNWENSIVELVDRRLVRFEEQRYKMHPMVRRYGLEVLEKSGEREKYEEKFSEFFSGLVASVYDQLKKEEAVKWVRIADIERENILSVLRWFFEKRRWENVIDYIYALDRVFDRAVFWTDRQYAIRLGIEAAKEKGDKKERAKLLHNLGVADQATGNYPEAEKLYRESLKIRGELGDKSGIASSLHQLGMIKQDTGDYPEAEKLYQQSLKIKEELGDKSGIANSLGQLGRLAEAQNDDEMALKNYLVAFLIFQEIKSPYAELAKKDIARMKQKLGEAKFQELYKKIKSHVEK